MKQNSIKRDIDPHFDENKKENIKIVHTVIFLEKELYFRIKTAAFVPDL